MCITLVSDKPVDDDSCLDEAPAFKDDAVVRENLANTNFY